MAPTQNSVTPASLVPGSRSAGLYDPRFEHDACGVGFVATCQAGAATARSHWRSRCCATSTTAAPKAPTLTPATARASSPRSPTTSARRRGFELPPTGYYAAGIAFLPRPARRRGSSRRDRADRAHRGIPCSAGAGSARPGGLRRRRARGAAQAGAAVRRFGRPRARPRPGPAARSACANGSSMRPASTSPACPARRSCTRACSPRPSSSASTLT